MSRTFDHVVIRLSPYAKISTGIDGRVEVSPSVRLRAQRDDGATAEVTIDARVGEWTDELRGDIADKVMMAMDGRLFEKPRQGGGE